MYRVPAVLLLLALFSATVAAERLPMRLYTTEDGLWSGFIDYLMRDSRGFIWFCTRDGLSRFDGYRFTNYKLGGLTSQNFTYMFESRKGVFWLVVGGGQLYRYDPSSVDSEPAPTAAQPHDDGRTLLHAELVATEDFLAGMAEDRNGNLWAGGQGLFLVEEQGGRVSFREVDLHLPQAWKPNFLVRALVVAGDGSLWLSTTYGLLRRLPDGRVIHYHKTSQAGPEDVRVLLADKDGYIWAVYPQGPYILKPQPASAMASLGAFTSQRLVARPPQPDAVLPVKEGEATDLTGLEAFAGFDKNVREIYQQSNGSLWLVAPDRLLLFDGRRFHALSDARGVFAGLIDDSDGNLWITTTVGGVAKLSVRGLLTYEPADGLGNRDVASIHEDREGRLQVVGADWEISELDGRRFKAVRPNIPAAEWLWSSNLGFLDSTGQWWLLTRLGLFRFAPVRRLEDLARATPTRYTTLDGLPAEWVYCMFEDSRGDLWISVRRYEQELSGLVRWRRADGSFHRFTQAEGLPPVKSAASFAEDQAGNLWFGFYEGGLARYAAGRFTYFAPGDDVPARFVTSLHVDRRGRLWMTSTSDGLARIDDPTAAHPNFVRYTTQQGLSSNNARTITEDLAGDIYIGTVRGVDRLTPETGRIKHYGLADGLAGDFVTTSYRDRKGALWFGTFNGLSRLEPEPEPAPAAPPIRIEGLRIAGVKRPLSEFGTGDIAGLELSAGQSNLQIDFSSLSLARAPLLRYQYQLQGIDKDWSAPTDQRTVHYANLAPGGYRFLVRAVDPSGLGSTQPASVEFRIFPPLWQRWWFLTMIAMAIAIAVTLLYRYRVAHLLELERVRTHIATDLHDDIGSSLSQIAVLSEVVRRQMPGTDAVSQPLSTIASTSRELVDSMSDIVWAINPNRDNLADLAQRMRRFSSDLFAANDIEFRFNAREAERSQKLNVEVRRQVFLIFKEAAHNIVRHSACSNVDVDLHIENHAVTLTLKDDGKGFDAAQAVHGHGLSSMSQRAKTLGGAMEIRSTPSAGTMVSLKVPLARHAALR